MAKVEIVVDYEGVGELLKSQEMQDLLTEVANQLTPTDVADGGYKPAVFVGKKRTNARITTTTGDAMRDNLENNTLLKCLSKKLEGGGK